MTSPILIIPLKKHFHLSVYVSRTLIFLQKDRLSLALLRARCALRPARFAATRRCSAVVACFARLLRCLSGSRKYSLAVGSTYGIYQRSHLILYHIRGAPFLPVPPFILPPFNPLFHCPRVGPIFPRGANRIDF